MARAKPDLVSVVIATFNGSPWVTDQLSAVISQQCDIPFEIVVVDGGSTDDTVDRCRAFQISATSLRIFEGTRRRLKQPAQRAGVLEARGDLLAFVDQDDVCAPGWLQALVNSSISFDMVGGALDTASLNAQRAVDARPWIGTFVCGLPYLVNSGLDFAAGANCAIWRSVFLAIDEPENDLPMGAMTADDLDLGFRLHRAGGTLGFAPDAVVAYRLRGEGCAIRRQLRAYGAGEAMMVKRYRCMGAHGDSLRRALGKWLFIAPRAAKAALEHDDLHWARSEWSVARGRLAGSLRYRTWCL